MSYPVPATKRIRFLTEDIVAESVLQYQMTIVRGHDIVCRKIAEEKAGGFGDVPARY